MKLIKSVGINEKRGIKLKEKSMELLVKSKLPIKEVDIVNFLIDEVAEKVDIDTHGFYLREDDEETKKENKK